MRSAEMEESYPVSNLIRSLDAKQIEDLFASKESNNTFGVASARDDSMKKLREFFVIFVTSW